MNGAHDLGGMMGFGPIFIEENEPNFHEEWEKRVFAASMLGLGENSLGSVDMFRHAIERMGAVNYLSTTYYEHWLHALETLAVERGLKDKAKNPTPITANVVEGAVKAGAPSHRDIDRQPKYSVGDKVRSKNLNPHGHTRLPRYARGRIGEIEMLHGNHVYPDTVAHGQGEKPQPLYSVKFSAQELWGDDAPGKDCLCIDLWEDYLEDA
ncbi:MAG: nitrile hydratase subunit beta [Gammaproteobacteria bacterium]